MWKIVFPDVVVPIDNHDKVSCVSTEDKCKGCVFCAMVEGSGCLLVDNAADST